MRADDEKQRFEEMRALLEELLSESVDREKRFTAQEKLIRRRIMSALGRVKTMKPITELSSPTGIKSKWRVSPGTKVRRPPNE